MNADGTDLPELSEPVSPASHAIARMHEPATLPARALQARRLIFDAMPDARSVDTFRDLRTTLAQRQEATNAVILVTGVGPRCGTTYVAKNLATAIAFDEMRTALLIDCNLRRPALAPVFALDPEAEGLVDFLRTPAIGLPTILRHTGIPRLRLIAAGRAQRGSGECLASYRMRALIDVLRSRYADRSLVLDAPPALGSPDARILAALADVVVLVAGDGLHRADSIAEAARAFPPAKFAGVVFNHLP